MYNWITKWFAKRWLKYEDGVNSGITEPRTLANVHVDEHTALAITSVWCAVNNISSMIAGMPLNLYQHVSKGKRIADEHPLHELLHDCPCPELTKEQFWQTAIASVLLHGNMYAEIERDEAARPVALWLLPPTEVKVHRDAELGLLYSVRVSAGNDVVLLPDNMFHVAGLAGHDGIVGFSPIRLCRESLALSSACERFGAAFFGNSARPAGVLQSPLPLSPNARENLRKSWENLHSGSSNTGRTAILEDNVTWSAIGIPNEDAQFLETRQYQGEEVCRIFNIPKPFIHDLSRATWANLETLNRQLVQMTLKPWLQKIEGQIKMKLLSQEERKLYFAEHDTSELMKPDTLTRYQAYQIATGGKPWLMPSEVREDERLDPMPEIDNPQQESNGAQSEQQQAGI